MSWGEAIRQVQTLIDDPTAQIAAKVSGHKRPWSYEWAAIVDLFDAFREANFKMPKPYPRPWPAHGGKRHGHTTKSRAEVVSILNAHGHKISA